MALVEKVDLVDDRDVVVFVEKVDPGLWGEDCVLIIIVEVPVKVQMVGLSAIERCTPLASRIRRDRVSRTRRRRR